jgi:GT2 family glycosyltransferase
MDTLFYESTMDLSVITVTWNSEDLIAEQIRSVQAGAKQIHIEQFIVDNASTDNTVSLVEEMFPEVTVIANDENKGFGAANNQAALQAEGDFLLFLNPDMRVEPETLDILVDWMKKHHNVGILSPRLVDEHGELHTEATPRRFPRLWEQLALILKVPHVFPGILHRYHMRGFADTKLQEVGSVRGSFMLMRKSMIQQLGWAFDPRYYIWYEDVDICREAKRLGYKVVYNPAVSCVDYVGQSFKKRTTLWKQKQFTASMLTYYKKWEPWYISMWIAIFRPVGLLLAWINELFHKKKS